MFAKIFLLIFIITSSIFYYMFLFFINRSEGNGILIGGFDFIPDSITGKERKGAKGEKTVNNFLRLLLKKNEYILSNIMVPSTEGTFYEIDSLLISNKGIFCIETKSWRGNITGGNKDKYWVQSYNGRTRICNKIFNPVMQNENHCKILEELLDFRYPVDNIVIFTKQTNLRCIQSKNVFTLKDFKECYFQLENDQLSKKQIVEVVDKLCPYIANVIALTRAYDKM